MVGVGARDCHLAWTCRTGAEGSCLSEEVKYYALGQWFSRLMHKELPSHSQCRNSDLISMGFQSGIFFKMVPMWTLFLAMTVFLILDLPSPPNNENTRQNNMKRLFSDTEPWAVQRRETSEMSYVCPGFLPGTLLQCWWKWRMVQLLWKTVSSKVKYSVILRPSIDTPKYWPKRNESVCWQKYLNPNVHRSFTHNSCKVETIQMSINKWMNNLLRNFIAQTTTQQ